MTPKHTYLCKHCGSNDVLFDAWAQWNDETQEFELSNTFDDALCGECEATMRWVEPTPLPAEVTDSKDE